MIGCIIEVVIPMQLILCKEKWGAGSEVTRTDERRPPQAVIFCLPFIYSQRSMFLPSIVASWSRELSGGEGEGEVQRIQGGVPASECPHPNTPLVGQLRSSCATLSFSQPLHIRAAYFLLLICCHSGGRAQSTGSRWVRSWQQHLHFLCLGRHSILHKSHYRTSHPVLLQPCIGLHV
jgi:hypothetical protein